MAKREIHRTTPANAGTYDTHATVMVDHRSDHCIGIHAVSEGRGTLIWLTPGEAESLAKHLIVAADAMRENRRG